MQIWMWSLIKKGSLSLGFLNFYLFVSKFRPIKDIQQSSQIVTKNTWTPFFAAALLFVLLIARYYWQCLVCSLGRGPNHENEKIITAVCFFTVIIHIKDLENVCNTQKSNLAMGLFRWKFENPHYKVKNQSCRKLYIWVSKPISRKIQNQWKKN